MNSTITDQIDQIEKPTCSAKIDQIRLRLAILRRRPPRPRRPRRPSARCCGPRLARCGSVRLTASAIGECLTGLPQAIPHRLHGRVRHVNTRSHPRHAAGCASGIHGRTRRTKRIRNKCALASGSMSDGSTPRFLQGAFEFEGNGFDKPVLIDDSLRYVVPAGCVTQPVYFRGGNSSDDMVIAWCCSATENRCATSPLPPRGATHVALRVVEDLLGDTVLELFVAAPDGLRRHASSSTSGLVEISRWLPRLGASSATAWPGMRAIEEVLARGGGDDVRHHRVRRRAVRQLQPNLAVAMFLPAAMIRPRSI